MVQIYYNPNVGIIIVPMSKSLNLDNLEGVEGGGMNESER